MGKYTVDFKEKVVQHYLRSAEGYVLTAKRFDTLASCVRKWVMAYRHHGVEGLISRRRNYSVEFKASVVQYKQKNGLSLSATAAKFNVLSISAVTTWEKLYNMGGIEALSEALSQQNSKYYQYMFKLSERQAYEKPDEEKTQKELIAELQYARAEVACLKKLKALIQEELALKKKRK